MNDAKRGQAAAGAAILLAIIAGVLIFFVIVLPPAERAELLGDSNASVANKPSSSSSNVKDSVVEKILLTESPGRLDYIAQGILEHPLPVITVLTRTESEILAEKGFITAKKGVFTEKVGEFSFSIEDLDNTENVLLAFNVKEINGEIEILLNGEQLFSEELTVGTVAPIKLPKNMLEKYNVLELKMISPGVAFWVTNSLTADGLKVVADVTDIGAQSSKSTFLISETEKKNLEKIELRFQADCKMSEVSKLRITINGEELYDALPDCDLKTIPLQFAPDIVKNGENTLEFYTVEGTYQLSHVEIKSFLKDLDYPTYYFEVSKEEYDAVKDEDLRLRLEMNFVDLVDSKFGEIVFNGHLRSFDTKEVDVVLDLSEDMVKGNNALKIKPKRTLEIREVQVELVK